MLERYFKLSANGTSVRIEVLAGLTTFLTMSYIIFLQPAILTGALFGFSNGMDAGAVMVATCLAAALATAIMGLYAKYPIAQAPGMGENFVFVLSVVPAATAAGFANGWAVALGVVFISGLIFLLLTLVGVREMLLNAISPSMKNAMAAGIGLFIAFIGLNKAGLIVENPGALVMLNPDFFSPDLLIFFFGLLLTAILHTRRVRGAILWGIVGGTMLALVMKLTAGSFPAVANLEAVKDSGLMTQFVVASGIVSTPPPLSPTLFQMDLVGACTLAMLPFIVIFVFMDMFDTIGTLIGVSEQAGFMKDNKLPRAKEAMLSDAVGTVVGACLGTSTVTSFIESASGVEQGGRTGLTSLTVAALFLIALFFSPLVEMVGSYAPITAPALVIVGSMMIHNVTRIDWADYSEAIPAFLIVLGIPLTFSIADGLALGFISYPIIKFGSGRGREVKWLMYLLALVLVVYFVVVRSRMG